MRKSKSIDIQLLFRYDEIRTDTLLFRVGGGTALMKPSNHHTCEKVLT